MSETPEGDRGQVLSPIEVVAAAEAVAERRIATTSVDDVCALMPALTEAEARLIQAALLERVRARAHGNVKR